jgi:hypothetical protein
MSVDKASTETEPLIKKEDELRANVAPLEIETFPTIEKFFGSRMTS